MKVSIVNNWCNTEDFFVYKLLKNLFDNVEFSDRPLTCDVLIHSVFGNDPAYIYSTAKYKIFVTHETRFYINIANERIPYSDMVLSYMPTQDKFFRIPLWYFWIDWFNENQSDKAVQVCGQSHHYFGGGLLPEKYVPTPTNILVEQYTPEEVWNRPHNFAMLVGNREPDCLVDRVDAHTQITQEIGPVSGFGLAFGQRFEGSKIDLLTNFKSNICYENSIHEGYTTEKPLDAKFAGCLPVYNGCPKYSKIDFNPNAFLNRQDYSSTQEFVSEIKKIILDKSRFIDIISHPMFLGWQKPSLDNVNDFLTNKIKF